jgi:hypothetical protein
MQMYRVETTISNEGTLTIKGLPFQAGDKVEVIVCGHERKREGSERYPSRGKPIRYVDPFESVAEDDWDALK